MRERSNAASEDTEMEDQEEQEEQESAGDVFETLKSDHRKVQELFTRFEDADKRGRASIAEEALTELEIHAAIEEELVYPAIREVLEEEDMIDEALQEHHVARLLIKELRKMNVNDEEFPPKFKVLGEIVGHHIEEEENETFPQAEEGGLDQSELAEEVMQRKEKLMQKYAGGAKKSGGQRRKKAA
jgi:hypothetical protein